MQYKKKPLLYKIKQFWDDNFCDYRHRFIGFKWFRDFKYWFKYTYICPVNVLKIKSLPCGHWIDKDEILLHSSFQILVNFVKHECMPGKCYSRDLMLLNIDEHMESYKDWSEEDKKPMRESLEEQNRVTNEILFLYEWWTVQRPIRLKNEPIMIEDIPESTKGPSNEDQVITRDEYGDPLTYSMEWLNDKNPIRKAIYERQHKWEELSEKEDEEMLIRLMKIRKCMWT